MSRVLAMLIVPALCAGCHPGGKVSGPPADQTVARPPAETAGDAQGLATFAASLKEYAALHDRLEKTLPPLAKDADPAAMDKHHRALSQLIRESRKSAQRGHLFTTGGERAIKRTLAQLFVGADGSKIKASIMDENPVSVKLAVNGRYPDEVPLSTVPPQVLAMLPKLPEELEYRFIGPRLILLDIHAHTVADYIENVLPV